MINSFLIQILLLFTSVNVTSVSEVENLHSSGAKNKMLVKFHNIALVITGEAANIEATSALLVAKVVDDGGEDIISRGFYWADNSDVMNTGQQQVVEGQALGTFTFELTNLSVNSTYHFLAFAETPNGVSYGQAQSFTTRAELPVVITAEPTNQTDTEVTIAAKTVYDGGAEITEQGWFMATSPDPVDPNNIIIDETGQTTFSKNITNLSPNTTYYLVAFAHNQEGTGYGEIKSFTTLIGQPEVKTLGAVAISPYSAYLEGEVVFDGGDSITEQGIYWGEDSNPAENGTRTISDSQQAAFSVTITEMLPNTLYYFAAFAENSVSIATGEVLTLQTPADIPTVETLEPIDITSSSAVLLAEILSNGGVDIINKGFIWALDSLLEDNPQQNLVTEGNEYFELTVTGLESEQIYYFAAFAENSEGVAYGETIQFQTETSNTIKFIPNAFVPASHLEENRVYRPTFREIPSEYTLEVFNRWGTRVFVSNDPALGWDGQYESKDAPMGGYIYHLTYLDADGSKHKKSGTLMLIR